MVANFSGEDEEAGSYSEEIDRPSLPEIKAAAEVLVYLEENLNIQTRWLRVRVLNGLVKIQGSVQDQEELKTIEEGLARNPYFKNFELALSLRDPDRD